MVKDKIVCKCCKGKKPVAFFHSKCCMAHFEGVVLKDNELTIACEKCGKFAGYIVPKINNKEVENGRH